MKVQTQNYGAVQLGKAPEGSLETARQLKPASKELTHLSDRLQGNLLKGWPEYVEEITSTIPETEGLFGVISDAQLALMGVMHVYLKKDYPHPDNWMTQIVLLEEFWGGHLSTDVRSARQKASFECGPSIMALWASVKNDNTGSYRGNTNLGGVYSGPDPKDSSRSMLVTINPALWDDYWKAKEINPEDIPQPYLDGRNQTLSALNDAAGQVRYIE